MYDVLRFWLDRGVDGFRVDVLWLLIKDDQFRDNPPNPAWRPNQPGVDRLLQRYSADRPEVQDVVAEMRGILDAYTGSRAHWRGLFANQAPGRLLRTRHEGRSLAIQLPAHLRAMECRCYRGDRGGIRGGVTERRHAELGSRQS